MDFQSTPLDERFKRALAEVGFSEMTEIQALTLAPLLEGRDVVGQSATGSGKTLAFGLPLLQRLGEGDGVRALVLTPTRELAAQVTRELRRFGRHLSGLRVVTLSGGVPMRAQREDLAHGANVVVGTPGRILDHLRRETLDLADLEYLVLDEADRMLDLGFWADVKDLLAQTPTGRQLALFSATLPPEVLDLSQRLQKNPLRARVGNADDLPEITHAFVAVESAEEKRVALTRLLAKVHAARTLIFCNQKITVDELARALDQAAALHGDLEQRERDLVLARFRNGSARILVATDVAARGLDVKDLDLVVNYDVPFEAASYTHRAGRTGRAQQKGLVVSLANMAARARLREFTPTLVPLDKVALTPPPEQAGAAEMCTLRIFGGRKDKLRPGDILGALTGEAGLKASDVGQIEIHDTFAFVGVSRERSAVALAHLEKGRVKGRRFRVALV